jgi:two-component system response regulator MprA
MRILIAEDQRTFALHIGRALECEGHSVTVVPDGDGALRLGRTANFDLILLDVMLPRMNGFDVIRRIRDDRQSLAALWKPMPYRAATQHSADNHPNAHR